MAHQGITDSDLRDLATAHHQIVLSLIDGGSFPEGWVDDYCTFLGETLVKSGAAPFWSWRLIQAIHFVSFHLRYRYGVWRSSKGMGNAETERQLGRVQLESELFLWNSVCGVPSFLDSANRSGEQETDERDVALVKLCFEDNRVLRSHEADASVIEAWRQEYRTALSAVQMKWHSRPHVWKWLALAVRFASFYMDVALVPLEVRRHHEDQQGLDPNRIREALQRLGTRIPSQAVIGVIELWLRLSHLPRDSSGLPLVLSPATPTVRSMGVRIASEAFLQADPGT